MRDDTIKPIGRLLRDRASRAREIVEHAMRLESLAQQLREELEPVLTKHFRVAAIDGGRLLLHADSPAWAARLRYQVPALLSSLRGRPGLAGLQSVQIRVRPPSSEPAARPRRPRLSAQAGISIRTAASACEHPELRQALLRLARRARGDRT
jgi:hypothetical protein